MNIENIEAARLSNQSVRIMRALLDENGIAWKPLLAAARIDVGAIDEPGGEISGTQELAFQRAYLDVTRHVPGLWLRTGFRYKALSYGLFGLAGLTSATFEDAAVALTLYQDLNFSLMKYRMEYEGDQLRGLAADDSALPDDLEEFVTERALGSVTSMINDLCPQGPALLRIETSLGRPRHWAELETLVRVPVIFDCESTRWILKPGVARAPLPLANPMLRQTYGQLCEQRIQSNGIVKHVAAQLSELLARAGQVFPTAAEAASQLAISERTLHRRLEENGSTFGQILDRVREQRARRLLAHASLSVERIAESVGFAESASFSRAFKRWTGESPVQYRRCLIASRSTVPRPPAASRP